MVDASQLNLDSVMGRKQNWQKKSENPYEEMSKKFSDFLLESHSIVRSPQRWELNPPLVYMVPRCPETNRSCQLEP